MRRIVPAASLVLSVALPVSAQDRPSEADLFGQPATPSAPASPPAAPVGPSSGQKSPAPAAAPAAPAPNGGAAPAPANPRDRVEGPTPVTAGSRDAEILGGGSTPMFTEEAAPEDPLRFGGQLYLRAQTTASSGQVPGNWSLNAPLLLDVYLDARPNDRVRAYVLTRTSYDPTLPQSAGESSSLSAAQTDSGNSSGSQSLSALFQQPARGPNFALDQMWLRFDVARTVFVTAGKQHARWGTGRFWAPTDYLHLNKRNPLDVFDARSGTTMLKAHIPVESKAWNFYAYAVAEDTGATPKLGRIAGAARAELVLGQAELGLGVMLRNQAKPKYGIDLSAGLGDFDLYGELALRFGSELQRVRWEPNPVLPDAPTPPSWQTPQQTAEIQFRQVVDAYYPVSQWNGVRPQAVGGLSYSQKYNDNDTFTLGAEYFYNSIGYDSPVYYPGLVLPHSSDLNDAATFFYLGRHYGSVFLSFPAPFSLDNHTFTLSTLANFSDRSFITRFDYAFVALTHLRFEAFASARYGNENGEFRFGVKELNLAGVPFTRPAAVADFGLALRVAI